MKSEKFKRIVWVDNVKVLAMFLVLFDHLGIENEFLSDWIWSFHLPVFFLISGLFASNKKEVKEMLQTDSIRLLLPVLLWHLIGLVLWQPLFIYILHPNDFMSAFLDSEYRFIIGKNVGFGWFMICLFWMRLIYVIISKIPRPFMLIIGMVVLPTITWFLKDRIFIPFYLLNSFMAFPFFLMGSLFRKYIVSFNISLPLSLLMMVLTFVLSIILCSNYGRGSLNALEFGYNPALIYFQGIIGAATIFILCKTIIIENSILKVLGGGTIVILLFQFPFILLLKFVYKAIAQPSHPAPYFDVMSAFVSTLVVMALMYYVIDFVNTHCPILNGRSPQNIA